MSVPKKSARTPKPDPGSWVLDEARELVKRLEGTSVQRLAVAAGEFKIEIERALAAGPPGGAGTMPVVSTEAVVPAVTDGGAVPAEVDHRHPVLAPLVGTFYRAPEPGARPFVEEGDVIDKGQTVAIVEAMKLMNNVQADEGGRVAEIVVQDGQWVEFEQVLMFLEPVVE